MKQDVDKFTIDAFGDEERLLASHYNPVLPHPMKKIKVSVWLCSYHSEGAFGRVIYRNTNSSQPPNAKMINEFEGLLKEKVHRRGDVVIMSISRLDDEWKDVILFPGSGL